MSVREKILATNLDAWNHPRWAMLAAGLFAALGSSVGHFLLPHVVDVPLSDGIVAAFAGGVTVFLGLSLLALVD